MNMEKTIGNEELAYLFEDSFSSNKNKFSVSRESPEFMQLFRLYESAEVKMPEKGKVFPAKYIGRTSDSYLFSVDGFKDYVRVDDKIGESKYLKYTNIGDTIDVLISEVNETVYIIKGSIASIYESRAHENLKSLKEGESVNAHIKSLNPAGYEIEIFHSGVTLPGFMPNTLAGINKLVDSSSIVGKTFEVMIESYSENEGTYIVSRRRYLQTLIPAAVKQLTQETVYNGHVTGTTPFGVFVEFNDCLTGMIHKANVHPDWQEKLTEIKPGFQIEFYVKEIVKEKIILTQILRETLWDNIKNGQIIEGTVKETKQFGTLINLDSETVGLIHTSEMDKLGKKFTAGQAIKVKVLSTDRTSRKIFLTLAS